MVDVVVDSNNKNTKELLGQGIRAYIVQDFAAAVSALSTASELLVAEHGDDLHESLGDVYLYYGKALLSLSREESGALGDAVPKNNLEDSDEDVDEVENTETEGGDEKEGVTVNGEVISVEGKSGEKENEVGDEAGPSGSKPTEDGGDNDEDPTDLQVAWEVLELAKKIYQKHGERSLKNLAETMVVLGEISLESENFASAVNDIQEGLEIQKKLFGKDSRAVAETYYKLGIAYSTNNQIEEAIQSFKDSLEYLQTRIENLEGIEDNKDEAEEEIQEIKNLIPDIEEKIADMKSYKDETLQKIMSAVTESKTPSDASSSEANAKPASDISHLVKKKRKLDEILEEKEKDAEGSPVKKPSV